MYFAQKRTSEMKTDTTKPAAAISVREFHRRTGVSEYRLNQMLDKGQLECIKVSQRRLVLSRELARFGVEEQ